MEHNHAVPPVRFEELLKQELPGELTDKIGEMLAKKAESDERDMNPRIPVIQRFIEDEIARYGQISKEMADDRNPGWEALDGIFLRIVGVDGIGDIK